MRKTIIISGGEKGGLSYALAYGGESFDDRFIIACDKGYLYAVEENIRPDLIIGDFDSYSGSLPDDIPVEKLPVEKDDTDTMHAVREAINRKSDVIIICCACGGRVDHMLSNIQSARFAAERGCHTIIASEDTIMHILHNNTVTLERDDRYSLSVLSLSDKSVVSVRGTKYELENAEISGDFPIGQSNEWGSNTATISVSQGTVIIILAIFKTI